MIKHCRLVCKIIAAVLCCHSLGCYIRYAGYLNFVKTINFNVGNREAKQLKRFVIVSDLSILIHNICTIHQPR